MLDCMGFPDLIWQEYIALMLIEAVFAQGRPWLFSLRNYIKPANLRVLQDCH
jgi:bifunctional pyridoxal-dependent enzyme with beta-cystathionase and maltose regulon repressor activities